MQRLHSAVLSMLMVVLVVVLVGGGAAAGRSGEFNFFSGNLLKGKRGGKESLLCVSPFGGPRHPPNLNSKLQGVIYGS